MIDPALLVSSCDIFRPFGASSPVHTNIPCRIVPDVPCGRGSGLAGVMMWTHYIDVQPDVDIQDQTTRSAGADYTLYADGDGVRSPHSSGSMYVVVFVTVVNQGDTTDYKRVFLLRDTYV